MTDVAVTVGDLDETQILVPADRRIGVTRPPIRGLGVTLLILAVVQAVLASGFDLGLLRAVLAVATLLGLPTLVLVRRGALPLDTAAARVLVAFALSLLGVIIVGLTLNTVLPWLGAEHPLAPLPLALAWLVLDAGLLLWRRQVPLITRHEVHDVVRRVRAAPIEPAQTVAVVALILAAAGSVRLNNGAGGHVAVTGQLLAAVALAASRRTPRGLAGSRRPCRGARGSLAASRDLATGLGVIGHDVQVEWLSFQFTDLSQQLADERSAERVQRLPQCDGASDGAQTTSGVSGTVIFKTVPQLIFALVPVCTYLLGRRFLSRRLALWRPL